MVIASKGIRSNWHVALMFVGAMGAAVSWSWAQSRGPESAAPPTTLPAEGTSSRPAPRVEPSAADILRELTREENLAPRRAVRPSDPARPDDRVVAAPASVPPNAVAPPTPRLYPDGYRLVDRPGRLVRQDDVWWYSFESRSEGAPELPLRLLPNRLLEDMEAASEGGTRAVVFVVSGEVTEYRGSNYLLLQKLLVRPNLRNLQ